MTSPTATAHQRPQGPARIRVHRGSGARQNAQRCPSAGSSWHDTSVYFPCLIAVPETMHRSTTPGDP